MKKRWLLLLSLPLVLVGVLAFLIGTQSGLNLLISQGKAWAPGELKIDSAQGRLLGPLDLQGVAYSSPELELALRSLSFRWSPTALLKRHVEVEKLQIDGIRFVRTQLAEPAPDNTEVAPLPEKLNLPVSISIENLLITDTLLVLSPDAEPVSIDKITLSTEYLRSADLDVIAQVESELLDLNARIHLDPAVNNAVVGQVQFRLSPIGVAPISGETKLTGKLDALQIEQSVDAPYNINATVTLNDVLEKLSATVDISYAIDSLSLVKSDLPPMGVGGSASYSGGITSGQSEINLVVSSISETVPNDIVTSATLQIDEKLLTISKLRTLIEGTATVLEGNGTIDLATSSPQADLVLGWQAFNWPLQGEPQLSSPSGKLMVKGDADNASLSLTAQLFEAGEVTGDGTWSNSSIDANVNWTKLLWPSDGSLVSSVNGSAKLSGQADAFKLLLNSTAETPQVKNVHITSSSEGSMNAVDTAFNFRGLGGSLDGQMNVILSPALSFTAFARGSGFNPAQLQEQWPGKLDVALDAMGETVNDQLAVALKSLIVTGNLRDVPLKLSAEGSTSGSDITINKLNLKSGSNEMAVNGTLSEQLDLAWSINSPDLGALLPDAKGSITGAGSLLGTRAAPAVVAKLKGKALAYQGNSLNEFSVDANADTATNGKINATIRMTNGSAGSLLLERAELTASGSVNDHKIVLGGRSNQGEADLTVSGSLENNIWRYTLAKSRLAYPELAPWVLARPASGIVSAAETSLDKACFTSSNAELCVNGKSVPEGISADYTLAGFPVKYFKSFLPETTRIGGVVDGTGKFKQAENAQQPVASTELILKDIRLDVTDADDQWVRIVTMKPSRVEATYDDQGLDASASIDMARQGAVNATIKVTNNGNPSGNQQLSGKIIGDFKDISFIAGLAPELESLGGRVSTDITLTGTPAEPQITGGVYLRNGSASLATPGLVLKNIEATVKGNNSQALDVSITVKSGKGDMRVNGTVVPSVDKPQLDLRIKGENFTVADTPEAQANISPDITIKLIDDILNFNGEMVIPFASITPIELPPGVVQVSEDQLIVGEEPQATQPLPIKLRGRIKIVMGEDVSVDAFGLKARLTGDITATESPGAGTTAKGQLEIVDGTFKAYGQNLTITTGKVLFAGGPVDKPGFDVEAVRRVTSELEVGVRARGALAEPEFTLFSNPSMNESEQISYLVLGRPLRDNSPSENSAVRQAAMALGVAGGKLLTEKYGDKLGVDEIKIDSELRETGEQASLVVGKYLSPKLFVSYGVGLFEPVSTLRLNYSINEYIKLITESTESKSGGDVVFTFERGK